MPPRTQVAGNMLGRKLSAEEIDLIRRTQMPKGAGENEVALLVHFAEHTGLDPLMKQCWLSFRNGKASVQATIDGFRIVAGRSGEYEGETQPEWCGSDGIWHNVWTKKEPPVAARVGVYRKGCREPFITPARYDEYVQTTSDDNRATRPNFMWQKMPANQLAKCGESLSLRKAFPEYLSGVYSEDEMGQADNDEGAAERPAVLDTPAQTPPTGQASPRPTPRAAGAKAEPARDTTASASTSGAIAPAASPKAEAPKTDTKPTPAAQSAGNAAPAPRAHTTAGNQVAQILNPVRDEAGKIGVEPAMLKTLFEERFGHPTAQAITDEALEFANLAFKAPSDSKEHYVEFMRKAPRSAAA